VINNGFSVNAGRGIDLRMGKIVSGQMVPYASVAEANAATPEAFRYKGLVKLIDDGTGMKIYWYDGGVADVNLVQYAFGTASNGIVKVDGVYKLGGNLTQNTTINGQNNYQLFFDSLQFFKVNVDDSIFIRSASNNISLYTPNGGVNLRGALLYAQNGNTTIEVSGDINLQATENVLIEGADGIFGFTTAYTSISPRIKHIASDSSVFLTPKYVHRYVELGNNYNKTQTFTGDTWYEKTGLTKSDNEDYFLVYGLSDPDEGESQAFEVHGQNATYYSRTTIKADNSSSLVSDLGDAIQTQKTQSSDKMEFYSYNGSLKSKLTISKDSIGLGGVVPLKLNGNAGTAGQAIVSQGAALPPIWGTVSGGSSGDSSIHKWNLALTSDRTLNGNRMDLYLGGGGDSTVNLDTFSVNSNHGFSINDGEGGTIRTSGKDMYVTGLGHTQVSGVDSAKINSNKIRINANDSLILQSQNTVDVMSDIVKIKSQGALFLESVSDDINITPPIANSLLINNLPATGDTTNNKPLGINSSGKVYEMNYWPSTGGGGSGTVNSGTQYRLAHYATTGTAVSEAAAITGNRLLISDVNGVPTHSAVTSTEAGYLTGITSSVQTQLSNKLNISDTATMLSGANVVHKTGTENVYGAKTFISTLTTNGVANTGGITSTGGISTNGSVTVGAGATGNTGLFWLSTGNGIEFVNPSGQTTQGMSYKLQHATGGAFTWIIGSGYSPRMRMGNGTGLVIMPAGADILPDVSTALDVVSTTKGVRLTPMTRTQADAISGKATGLELYSTTDSCKLIWNGTKFMYIGKSGTYVPTYTSTANIASTVVTEIGYSINGDMLTITGEVEFGIVSTSTPTELRISLPSYVANNFTATKFGGGITYNDGSTNAFTITPVSGTTLIAFKSASPNLTTSYKYPFTVAFRIP